MSKHCVLLTFIDRDEEKYLVKRLNYMYCIEQQKLLEYKDNYFVEKVLFTNEMLSLEEQKECIKHIINTSHTEIYLSLEQHDINKNKIQFSPAIGLDMLFMFTNNHKPENVFDCFLYLLKIGTRMDALSDEESRKKRMDQLKQVSAEIECMPTRGVRFQEAKEEFNRLQ